MADASFGVFVEDMNSFGINGNGNGIAASCSGSGRYSCSELNFAGLVDNDVLLSHESFVYDDLVCNEVEVDFCAHQFGNVNVYFECAILESCDLSRSVKNRFGTNACDNFLAEVGLEIRVSCLAFRKLDLDFAELEVSVVVLFYERAVDEDDKMRCSSCSHLPDF